MADDTQAEAERRRFMELVQRAGDPGATLLAASSLAPSPDVRSLRRGRRVCVRCRQPYEDDRPCPASEFTLLCASDPMAEAERLVRAWATRYGLLRPDEYCSYDEPAHNALVDLLAAVLAERGAAQAHAADLAREYDEMCAKWNAAREGRDALRAPVVKPKKAPK